MSSMNKFAKNLARLLNTPADHQPGKAHIIAIATGVLHNTRNQSQRASNAVVVVGSARTSNRMWSAEVIVVTVQCRCRTRDMTSREDQLAHYKKTGIDTDCCLGMGVRGV